MLRRYTAATIVLSTLIGVIPHASAQIIEMREYRGKQISCMLSGLSGWGKSCGTDGGYAYIFIGSVLSATEISATEKRLQLVPQVMFLGDAVDQLTVTTNQGACLPEIQMGDHWLFYLQRDEKSKELLLAYGSPSAPIADAEPAITTLRRLAAMTGTGLIYGSLHREVSNVDKDGTKSSTSVPVANHKVIAIRDADGIKYSALSDNDGYYEFEPLPAGSYRLSANTAPGLWTLGGPTTVRSRSCTAYSFQLHTDGVISGHVRSADGKPFNVHPWVVIAKEDGDGWQSSYVDDQGYFAEKGLEPGRYLVGIGIEAQPDSPEWRSRIYYPGVRTKEEATIIELGKSEKRTNIDFQLLNSASR